LSKVIDMPRELILTAARNILYNEGYEKLSMRNIAKQCDISLGTIYNYYPSKKDLVIEMMMGYWKGFFKVLEDLDKSQQNFYVKLFDIHNELSQFIKTFKKMWLVREIYDTPDYIAEGLNKEQAFMVMLILKIEAILVREASSEHPQIKLKFNSNETSKFIVMNLITMAQNPMFKYETFEAFLKELLK